MGSPAMNLVEGIYTSGTIRLANGVAVPAAPRAGLAEGDAVTLGIRPEHVEITASGLPATVDLIEPTGFGIIVHAMLDGIPVKIFTQDRSVMTAANAIHIAFPTPRQHIFDHSGARLS
jgi:multiple sugar transport system ATP-binding protein